MDDSKLRPLLHKSFVPFGLVGIFTAMGIVYGDIGTSPLYVMKSILCGLNGNVNNDFIIGAVSCIIWTLTLQTTVKYVMITLKADNNGEGGILSLFALIRKHHRKAYVIAIIGAATLLADGIITPSITVTSAMEGLNAEFPALPVDLMSVFIIIGIFLMQPLGTARLGKSMGKIMFLWFLMLGVLGLFNLYHFPLILKAFNPLYAIHLLINAPDTFVILGAVFLCTTGAEALYSDLGHCGLNNIRISWIYVKITLILNYLGQGAWVLTHKSYIGPDTNPFFCIMPHWFVYIGIAMATIAAIIASQALISGTFTIISEAISLDLCPNIKIKYPTNIKGQMFIPQINYALMILCVLIVLTFQDSSSMEAAYGLSITITMLMTTALLWVYSRIKKMSLFLSIPLMAFFLTIEGSFFIANLFKFAHGGWVTILIASVIFCIFFVWYNGRRIKSHYSIYEPIAPTIDCLKDISEDKTIPKFATNLVYVTRAKYKTDIESKISYSLIHKQPKRADTYWFVYLYHSDEPYHFSYKETTYVDHKIFRLDIYSGFKQGIHVDKFVNQVCNDIALQGKVDLLSRYPSLRSRGIEGDFRFVVVERIARNLALDPFKRIVLSLYYVVKKYSTSDTQMLDLDPSVVTLEYVPIKLI